MPSATGAPLGGETFLHARIGPNESATRCVALLDAVIADWWVFFWETDTLTPALEQVKTDILAWQGGNTAATRATMLASVRGFTAPGVHPELWDESNGQEYRDLLEVANIVANTGTDAGPGRRSVYARHAYHVKDVALNGSDGKGLGLTSADVAARLSEIDALKSNIVLENPHARNELDLDGNGPEDGKNDGRFQVSLHSFLTNLDLLRGATVMHP